MEQPLNAQYHTGNLTAESTDGLLGKSRDV